MERKGLRPGVGQYISDQIHRDYTDQTGSGRKLARPKTPREREQMIDDLNKVPNLSDVEFGMGSGIWIRGDEQPKQ